MMLVVLGGCVTYTPHPLDAGAIESRLERRSLDDAALTAWLASHGSPHAREWGLDRLGWASLYYSADVQVARSQWQSARAAAITAGARANPQLDVTSEYNRDAVAGEDPWTRGLSLTIPVDLAGKRHARLAAAVAKEEQARLEYADAAWTARRQVRDALVRLLAPATPLQSQADAQAERVRLMQRRFEVGLAGRPDLTQARLSLQGVETEAADARRELDESRAALAAAVGVSVDALAKVTLSLRDVEQPPPLDQLPTLALQREALLRRPDVLAALAGYQATEAALHLEVAKQYPDFALSPGLLWDAGAAKWTLGLSLVLPLLDRNRGPIAEAQSQREEAAARVIQAQAKALAELEQARASYAASLDALHAADLQVVSSTSLLGAAQRAQAAGTGIRSDVLGAQAEQASAQARRQRALMQTEKALGALEDAIRTPITGSAFSPQDAIRQIPEGTER